MNRDWFAVYYPNMRPDLHLGFHSVPSVLYLHLHLLLGPLTLFGTTELNRWVPLQTVEAYLMTQLKAPGA